ncbi:hypothetical protein BH10PSE14_BH10PSE14_25830 [soil metagenome]
MHPSLKFLGFLAVVSLCAPSESHAACASPDALGVSRTLVVNTSAGLEVGSIQYPGRLALQDMEVVLTFDDGPFPGPTEAVLDALREQCVLATFFSVGRMAKAYPEVSRRELAEGHTIGTHSNTHPESLADLPYDEAAADIDRGIVNVSRALGQPAAPFFRFPGLGHSHALRRKLAATGIGVFSADAMGYDWTGISSDKIRLRAIQQLFEHRGGILLLHDIHYKTAQMLPQLLRDLKTAGFHIVHIVPTRDPVPVAALRTSVTTFH